MLNSIRRVIRELIGQVRVFRRIYQQNTFYSTRDIGTADYAFYDRLRHGKAQGLEVAGLLVKPIISKIVGWTLGRNIKLRSDVIDTSGLEKWWSENLSDVIRCFEDSVALGDCYLVVNADLTITVVPPHVVEPVVDDEDYSKTIGYRIVERWPHPVNIGSYMTITDEYTADRRVRIVENGAYSHQEEFKTPFLKGHIPVIPIRNNVGSNETNGTPELDGAIGLLHRYGATLDTTIEGLKRSTPVAEFPTVEALNKFWDTYAQTQKRRNADGSTEEYETIPFSSDEFMAIVGKMYYANPTSIAGDAEKMLILLYLILIEHAEIPEFVMGSAIASSKASAEEQMTIFVRYIDKRRAQAQGWVRNLLTVVQLFMVARGDLPRVDYSLMPIWEKLTSTDGRLTIDTLRWAYTEGLIDKETALKLSSLDIDDIRSVIDAADQERESDAIDYSTDLERATRLKQSDIEAEAA